MYTKFCENLMKITIFMSLINFGEKSFRLCESHIAQSRSRFFFLLYSNVYQIQILKEVHYLVSIYGIHIAKYLALLLLVIQNFIRKSFSSFGFHIAQFLTENEFYYMYQVWWWLLWGLNNFVGKSFCPYMRSTLAIFDLGLY